MRSRSVLAGVLLMLASVSRAAADDATTAKAKTFVADFIEKFRPIDIDANRAWWDANITGADEDFKRKEDAQNKIDAFLSSKDLFAQAKALKESKEVDDPVAR